MPLKNRTATGVLGGLAGLVGLSAVAGVLVTATVTPAIAVSGYAASSAISVFDNLPSALEIEQLMLPTEFYRKDSAGNDVLMTQFYDQNRIPVTFGEVATVMNDAIISSEDKNFFTHGGVDLVGTLGAVVGNLRGNDTRGGSSITQQYVKNVLQQSCEMEASGQEEVDACFLQYSANSGAEGIERKAQEMRYAIQIEKEYGKDEILLGYLNIAHFGGTVYGIGAAAQYYFNTTAANLTIGQAAAIAGMVQEPNTFRLDRGADQVNSASDGYALTKERQVYVLDRMYADGKITEEEHDAAVAEPITPQITYRDQGCRLASGAEFFCEYVRSIITTNEAFGESSDERQAKLRRGGLKIYTTIDPDLQAVALDAMTVAPANLNEYGLNFGASGIQVEVGTGRVLSMVQNRPYDPVATDENGQTTAVNYNVRAQNGGDGHNAGSTYKVFSLVNWLEQGRSVNEVLNGRVGDKRVINCDGATQIVPANNNGGIGNFQDSPGYNGTVKRFTEDSLNSGFFAMAEQISVCSTNRVAMKLGVMTADGSPLDTDNFGFNVLGSASVAPIDMAGAYAAIAGGGMLCEPKAIDRAVDADGNEIPIPHTCEQAISENVANTAADTLKGVMNATAVGARTFDGVPVFGKTGIHEYFQTWMDGSSSKVTTVVWVGTVRDTEKGRTELNRFRYNGWRLDQMRNAIWPEMQRAANAKYGGEEFGPVDPNLVKTVMRDLPSVVGMPVDQAQQTLEDAGFTVIVGDPIDSPDQAGLIAAQDPAAGQQPGGTAVTISPSTGQGAEVPVVRGTPQEAERQLRAAGFTNIETSCTEKRGVDRPVVTATDPGAGALVSRSTEVTIQYTADDCD